MSEKYYAKINNEDITEVANIEYNLLDPEEYYDDQYHTTCDDCPRPPYPPKSDCEFIEGNSLEIEVCKNDCEVNADIEVSRRKLIPLWGQVTDCDGVPVANALVKLLKQVFIHGKIKHISVSHTITDCMGFYQFELHPTNAKNKFRILVSKALYKTEKIVDDYDNY